MYKVCLDAGHGGKDPGATGPTNVLEKDINLSVAKLTAAFLKESISVILTREEDVAVTLTERSRLANENKADILVSIHCNAYTNQETHGVETYCYKMGGQGEVLARFIQKNLVTATGLTDRGVKEKNLHILRETRMPSALAELAFLTNPAEEALLKNKGFQEKCAMAIAKGIREYIGEVQIEKWLSHAAVFYKEKEYDAFILEGKAFVEVRKLCEELGKKVIWDNVTKTIEIKD